MRSRALSWRHFRQSRSGACAGPGGDVAPRRELWSRFDLASCKVAVTKTYRIAANWKLAVENTLECYHCMANIPNTRRRTPSSGRTSGPAEADVAKFETYHAAWKARLEGKIPLGRSEIVETGGQFAAPAPCPLRRGSPRALGTESPSLRCWEGRGIDESVTLGCIGFLTYLAAMCDHALLVTYIPQSVDVTLIVIKWLVHVDARDGVDYDPEKLCWLWDDTTRQDKDSSR